MSKKLVLLENKFNENFFASQKLEKEGKTWQMATGRLKTQSNLINGGLNTNTGSNTPCLLNDFKSVNFELICN